MKTISTISFIILISFAFNRGSCQNVVISYGICNGCWGTNPSYTVQNYTVSEISSDYGMRVAQGTMFHQGIDFVPIGSSISSGDAVVSIEGGVIELIQGTGLKKVVINGGTNGHIFSYLHLFRDDNQIQLPYRHGAFVLSKINNSNGYAIIDLVNNIAYSSTQYSGLSVTYPVVNGITYTTTDNIAAGVPFAPIGDSGTRAYHLHLSLLESGISDRSRTESIDPLNILQSATNDLETRLRTRKLSNGTTTQPVSNFNGNICDHSIGTDNWNNINLGYNNDTRNVIEVEVSMPNATVVNGSRGERFSDVVMNEDVIEVLIKKESHSANRYSRIHGLFHNGYIKIDPEGADNIYPGRIYNNYGGLNMNNSGVIPFAYRSSGDNINSFAGSYNSPNAGNPYDYYFFSDFYHRIHKNHTSGNQLRLGFTPNDVLYNDGTYNIKSKVINVNSIPFESVEVSLDIDNFQPFITSFDLFDQNNNLYKLPRYQFENSSPVNMGYVKNGILTHIYQPSASPITSELVVSTSEPMKRMSMGYDDVEISPPLINYLNHVNMTKVNDEGTLWRIGLSALEPTHYWFEFVGEDVSGNELMNVYEMSNQNSSLTSVKIPFRTGTSTWANTNANHLVRHDFFEVDIFCQRNIGNVRHEPNEFNRNTDCLSLDNVRSYANFNSSTCSVTIGLANVDMSNFDIGWMNEAGNYEIGTESKEVSAPGNYCYVVESRDGCCYIKGCIEVKNMLELPEPFIGTDCNGSYMEIEIDPNLYEINWYVNNSISYSKMTENEGKTKIFNLLPNADYKVIVELNGCSVEYYITTGYDVFNKMTIDEPQITNTSCDLTNGSITFIGNAIHGGVPPYSYFWSTEESNLNISNLGTGNYSLTITDDIGCELIKDFEINVSENYLISQNIVPSCKNSSNGSIEIFVREYNGIYPTFDWGQPSANLEGYSLIENLSPGTYCVTVTYENQNCVFVECFEVYEKDNEPLLLNSDLVKPCVNQNNGEINLILSGGALPYTFNWSNGSIYKRIDNLKEGVYSVTITDGCGNSIDQSFLLDSRNATELDVTYIIKPKDKYNQQILTTISGGMPPYSYNWKKYNNIINEFITVPGNIPTLEGQLFPGKYILTVHDATKCFVTHEIFECENAIAIDFDLETINLSDCEHKMEIKAKAIDLVGNGDYKYLWNNSSNYPEYIIPIDELNMFYEPSLAISDKCGFYKKLSKKIPCGEFCSNSCIIQIPTTNCFDECDDSDFLGFCTKVATVLNCEDNNLRELYPYWYGTFYNYYLGSNEQEISFEDLEPRKEWAGQRAHFIINNKTTGCTTVNSFKFPPRCTRFVIWDLILKKLSCPSCPTGGEIDDDSDIEDSGDEVYTYYCPGEPNLMECEEEFSECVQMDFNGLPYCYTWVFCYSTQELCGQYIRKFDCDEIEPGTECPEFITKFSEKYPVEESNLHCGNQLLDIDFTNPDQGVYVFLKNIGNDSIHCEKYNSDSTITKLFKISSLKNNALFSYGKSSFINIYEISSDTIGISKLNAIGIPISEIKIAGYQFVKYVKLSQDRFEIYVKDNVSREYSVILFNKFNISNIASLDLNNSFLNEEISLIGTFDNINLNSIEALRSDSNITDYDSILKNLNITYSSKIDRNTFALVGSLNKSISTNFFSFDSAQNILLVMNKTKGLVSVEPIGYFGDLKINSIKKSTNNVLYLNGMEDINNQDTESCPFIYFTEICALSNCCEKLKPIIIMDSISCQFSLENFDSTATYSLFLDQNGVYVNVADSLEFPYSVVSLNNSSFYLSATSASCEYVISDTLSSLCLDTIFCPLMSSLYYTSPDSFIYFDLVLQDSVVINVEIQMSYFQGDTVQYIVNKNFLGAAGLNTFGVNIENLYPISYGYLSYWKFIVTYDSFPASCPILVDDWDWGPAIKNYNSDSRAIGTNSVLVYPNPYTKGLVVDISSYSEQEIKLNIVNAIGQVVFSDNLPLGNGENRYICQECDNFPAGLYSVILRDSSKKSIFKKVVKF